MRNSYLCILLIFPFLFSIDLLFSESVNKKNRILPDIRKSEKNNKRVPFIGSIVMPEDFECPSLWICYNGKLTKIKKDFSSFIIKDFDRSNISILFVSPDNLTSVTEEENNINNFKIKNDSSYKFFSLEKIVNKNENSWIIQENTLSEIPLNTFIFFIDPDSIDFFLKNVTWNSKGSVVELPKVVINKIVDKSKLTKSCISFMDIKPFHKVQDKKEIVKKNVRISMLL